MVDLAVVVGFLGYLGLSVWLISSFERLRGS